MKTTNSEPKWTPLRRDIFAALETSETPLGAYDLIEKLASTGTRHAPMTIYRTLDFLMENHLVHKVESQNTFFVCKGSHKTETAMVLMMCDVCKDVTETQSLSIQNAIIAETQNLKFTPRSQVLELRGVCEKCS